MYIEDVLIAKHGLLIVSLAVLLVTCGNTLAKNSQDTLEVQQEDISSWVDPHDLSLDPGYINRIKHGQIKRPEDIPDEKSDVVNPSEQGTCQEPRCEEQKLPDTPTEEKILVTNDKFSSEMSHFKQLTQCVLKAFPASGQKYVTMEMSEYRIKALKQFLDSNDKEEIHDAFKIICDIFKHIKEGEKQCYSIWTSILMSSWYNIEIIAIFVICLSTFLAIMVVKRRLRISWFQQFMYLLSVLFLVSIPWEWIRMYKHEFAAKQAAIMKDMPDYCQTGVNLTVFRSFSRWVSNLVQWQNDECGKYHAAMLVDAVWEVSPSQAFANTVARFFTTPLKPIADDLGKSLNIFFQHIPIQWQPVIFFAVLIFLIFIVAALGKLRLKLWLFEIGPSNTAQPRRLTEEDYKALENRFGDVISRALLENDIPLRPRREPVELEQKEDSSYAYPIPDTQPLSPSDATFPHRLPFQEIDKSVENLRNMSLK